MFTGIVEHCGVLREARNSSGGKRLQVDIGPLAEGTRLGESICVSGACLTVVALQASLAGFDISHETLKKTTCAAWQPGRAVNCERALRLGDRLGGHLVSGHVDGVGRLLSRRPDGDGAVFTFVLPSDASVHVIEKGSICVDGVSLTSWDCRGARFSVALVPHTLQVTSLGALQPGAPVNLEQDQIGRWVARLLPGGGG